MAMHKLTGGMEAYDPWPSPPLPGQLGRNNTVSGGERTAASQFMLSRLGGRIAKAPSELSSRSPSRSPRRTHRTHPSSDRDRQSPRLSHQSSSQLPDAVLVAPSTILPVPAQGSYAASRPSSWRSSSRGRPWITRTRSSSRGRSRSPRSTRSRPATPHRTHSHISAPRPSRSRSPKPRSSRSFPSIRWYKSPVRRSRDSSPRPLRVPPWCPDSGEAPQSPAAHSRYHRSRSRSRSPVQIRYSRPTPPTAYSRRSRSRSRSPMQISYSSSRSRSPRRIPRRSYRHTVSVQHAPVTLLGLKPALSKPRYHESHSFPSSASANSLSSSLRTAMFVALIILFDFIPGQIYLHFLLRIPSLYFSRVTRIFEDARLSLPDIKRMANAKTDQWNSPSDMFMWPPNVQQTPNEIPLPRSLLQFRSSWEGFIDSLMREWKTFNIISVLLLSAILTMLQIESASHPITRVSALLSLICALMSLLYGCMYIIRFGTMRKMHKASSFANEAQKGTSSIWWNIWVLLAMPAVWLAWSIISFLTCIMSFIWLTGSSQDQDDFVMSSRGTLGSRIGLTLVFALGVVYFVLIIKTFHRYGDPLDREWMRNVDEWMKEAASYLPPPQNLYDTREPPIVPFIPPLPHTGTGTSRSITPDRWFPHSRHTQDDSWGHHLGRLPTSNPPLTSHPSAFFKTPQAQPAPSSAPVEPLVIMELGDIDCDVKGRTGAYADPRWTNAISAPDWYRFMMDISSAWRGQLALTRPAVASSNLELPSYTSLSVPKSCPLTVRTPHTIIPSESSYGSIKPSKYMTKTEWSAPGPGAPAPAPEIPIIHAFTDTRGLSRSLTPTFSPPPAVDGGSVTSQEQEQQKSKSKPDPVETVHEFIALWNERYFFARNLQAFLIPYPREDSPKLGPTFFVELASRARFSSTRNVTGYQEFWARNNHAS